MMNITLKSEQEEFIQAEIKKGRYQTAEQVISEALKLLEEVNQQRDELRLEELRQKIAVGTEQIQKDRLLMAKKFLLDCKRSCDVILE